MLSSTLKRERLYPNRRVAKILLFLLACCLETTFLQYILSEVVISDSKSVLPSMCPYFCRFINPTSVFHPVTILSLQSKALMELHYIFLHNWIFRNLIIPFNESQQCSSMFHYRLVSA